jgi:hypothetical protein
MNIHQRFAVHGRVLLAVVATASGLAALPDGAIASAEPSASGGSVVALAPIFRRCDFSSTILVKPSGMGRGTAVVRAESGRVSVDVTLQTARPDTRYDVRLIQEPRASFPDCGPGAPGVVASSLTTDAGGNANATLNDAIQQGATGAWVYISIPGEFSQAPAESYTSDYVASI